MENLREDWVEVELGEVCFTTSGGTPSRSNNEFYNGSIPWVKSGELDKGIIYDTEEKISDEAVKNSSAKVFPKDTLLIALYGATIGKLAFLGVDAATNQAICGIYKSQALKSKYLYNFLLNRRQKLISQGTGGAQPNISQTILKKLIVPIAPLPIQRAIVTKIENLFASLDKGIADLEKAQQQLKVYRQAVLEQGLTGKFTAQFRKDNPQLESSELLFQKIQEKLDEAFKIACAAAETDGIRKPKDHRKNKKANNVTSSLPKIPHNWNYYRLEDITYLVTDGTHFTPKYKEEGVKFLSVKNVRPFFMREEHVKYISQEEHEQLIKRCKPENGDILYTKVGATYGFACKVNLAYEFSIFVSLCLIKPVYEFLLSDFLEILMNSELVFRQARQRVSGSGVPDLHLVEIRDFKVPLPPLEEQHQIVREIESRLSVCDKVEQCITESLEKSKALRQSILKKAFEGKLLSVAEIDKCKQEKDYEPAAKLLEKIKQNKK
jgi:type I restriction enzyme S subunit